MAIISKCVVDYIMMTRTPLLYVAQWHWSLAIQMFTHSSLDVTDLEIPTNSLLIQMPGVSHIKQSPIENSSIIVIKDREYMLSFKLLNLNRILHDMMSRLGVYLKKYKHIVHYIKSYIKSHVW